MPSLKIPKKSRWLASRIEYREKEIGRCRREGHKYVNFTCLQTLEEAEADLTKLRKEYLCLLSTSIDNQKTQSMTKN